MTDRRWLIALGAAGLAIFALSFVNAWITHDRELLGEGYRHLTTLLGAWQTRGMPVLTVGALTALVVGIGALASAWRPRAVPASILLAGSAVVLGIVGSVAVPVGQTGHASSVRMSLGPLLPVGILLAALMVVAGAAIARPPASAFAALFVVGILAVGGGVAGRWVGLQWAEGTGEHWADGSYARAAAGELPAATLTIEDGRFTLGERWAGTWESSGWTIMLDGDPACPDSRGTYHAHGEGEADLRFVMVVDTCEDGARAAALEAGIWVRAP